MKYIYIIFFILSISINFANCTCFIDDLYKLFGTKTDYDEVRGSNNEHEFVIEGCSPFSIWFLTRHGSRYPDSEEIDELLHNLPIIKEAILSNTNSNKLCSKENDYIKKWEPEMTEFDDHNITVVGEIEMKELAARFRKRFENILKNDDSVYYARAAINRTQATIGHFMNEFFKDRPDIVPNVEVHRKDRILDYLSSCKKFKDFEANKTYCRNERDFEKTVRFLDNIKLFLSRLNLKKIGNLKDAHAFEAAYKACIYEYMIKNRTDESKTWCAPFTKEIIETIEFKDDLVKHCQYGYKYKISTEMTCDLRKNLLNYLRDIVNSDSPVSSNILFFSQGSSLLPFLSSLGLYQGLLYTKEYDEINDRQWRSSYLDPMNANILFTTYKCNDGSFKMKIFHNEKSIKYPTCDSNNVCDMREFINALAVTTDTCDFDKLCKGVVTEEDLVKYTEI